MLVCNVSLRPPRLAIAATIAEAVAASDATATGNIVFATLVDDPASVGDLVDAYLGEIMLEAASASEALEAGLIYVAGVDEGLTITEAWGGEVPAVVVVAMIETATANSAQDATSTGSVATTALVADGMSPVFVTPALASISILQSGTVLTVP